MYTALLRNDISRGDYYYMYSYLDPHLHTTLTMVYCSPSYICHSDYL